MEIILNMSRNRPSDRFPIVVSQDCEHEETTEAILKYSPQVTLIRVISLRYDL